jgi:hypothetical protein
MDEAKYKERVTRLAKVGKVLEKLPAEVRSAAFVLLESYIIGTPDGSANSHSAKRAHAQPAKGSSNALSTEEFFAASVHKKPSDNVKLIAAFHYREFGTEPFSVDEVRQLASDVGITIPHRVDMTLEQAKAHGKKLFARAGTGKFKVTVHGEAYLKTSYAVSKGTKKHSLVTQ